MRVADQIAAMRDAVGTSVEIKAWATDNYGHDHNVFVGLNTEDPPTQDQYPLVVFDPDTKGSGNDDQETKIAITHGLYDDSVATEIAANIFQHPAVSALETFRDLVITAAVAALPQGAVVTNIDDEFDREQPFPHYHLMQTVLTIIRPYEFRENRII